MLIRSCLLICSLFGYSWYLTDRTRPEFAPGITVTVIGSFMFLSGLANCLLVSAVLVCIAGLVLLLLQIIHKADLSVMFCFSNLLLTVACLYFLVMLYGMKLTGYDDFSHWGVVARILVTENRFPDLTDRILTFQAYPTGSASVIYYFTEISGVRAEWVWLHAQAVVILCLYISLFAFAETWRERLFLLMVFLILLCSNIFFINLLVDTEITACAISAMCFVLYYRENLIRMRWCLLPYAVFLIAIKTSGLFYTLVFFTYALLKGWKTEEWGKLSLILLVSFVPLVLWRLHVNAVFPEGMVTKHAFSLKYFLKTVSDKNWSGMKYIFVRLVLRTLSPRLETVYLLIFAAGLSVCFRNELKKKNSLLREAMLLILLSAVAYGMMVYVMYLISMPWYEAEQLAGFERYLHTYTAFAAGILSVVMLKIPDSEKKAIHGRMGIVLSIWVVLLLFTMGRRSDFYLRWPMERERRTYAEGLIAQSIIPPEAEVLIVNNDEGEDSGYIEYMFRYLLNTPDVEVINAEELGYNAGRNPKQCVLFWNPPDNVRR